MQTLNTALPDFSTLTGAASGNIKDLLGGGASLDSAQLKNAFWQAGSGLGVGSEFSNRRGKQLYDDEAAANKQTGLQNFLDMLKSFSGTVVPTTGQEFQNNQFNQSFAYRQQQDALSRADALRAQNVLDRQQQSSSWNGNQDGRFFWDQFQNKKPLVGISTFGTPY